MKSATLYFSGFEDERYQPHFLDSCSLCRRPLGQNSDIFMYRGNTPFCSQECRQEQIEIDEGSAKKWKISSNSKRSNGSAVRKNKEESGTNKAVRTGSVAVA